MLSKRCQRCWISFDTKRQASEHGDEAGCKEKEMPDGERLMSAAQETELETFCGPRLSEEDIWWRIFCQLIPGMKDCCLELLQKQYCPCEVLKAPGQGFLADSG
jgi:hypothetical protein